jgi:anti-anti-sigma factor
MLMFESEKICVVKENSNGELDVSFRNTAAFTPEFIPETAAALYSILKSAGNLHVRLNLSGIDFISSAAINMLLKIRHIGEENGSEEKGSEEKGIRFSLIHLEPSVQEVLRVTQLDRLFETQTDCESCRS